MGSRQRLGWWAALAGMGTAAVSLFLGWLKHHEVGSHGVILNRGMAFGMLTGKPEWLLIGASGFVMAVCAVILIQRPQYWMGMSILLGAGLANWVDRILWAGVVDYWSIPGYPFVFNFADVAIKGALAILLLQFWRSLRPMGARRP